MRITGVPCDFDGSGMYRIAFPFAALRARGHEAKLPLHERPINSYLKPNAETDDVLLARFTDLDFTLLQTGAQVAVIQRPVDRGIPAIIRAVREQGMAVVVDTDDWLQHPPGWNPSIQQLAPGNNPGRNLRVFTECAAEADALTCSTPFLAAGYGRYNPNTFVIRNYLERTMWEAVTPVYEARPWAPRVRVGYMGDPRWHQGDLRELAGVIGPWLDRNPNVDFVATEEEGDEFSTFDILQVPAERRVYVGRVPFRSLRLPEITATMDIGLVPLADHPFNEGKSHLKGMEYAACGIPCIASPTESYRWWAEAGDESGCMLARRAREWTRALDLLVQNPGVLRFMGECARRQAFLNFIDNHIFEWEDVFFSLVTEEVLA